MMQNRYLNSLIALIILSLLGGCATEAKYHAKLKQWHGQSIQKFIDDWGYPTRQFKALDGNTVYEYRQRNTTTFPVTATPGYTHITNNNGSTTVTAVPTYYAGGGTYHYYCTTWIEFNKKHYITRTSFRGNNCVSY